MLRIAQLSDLHLSSRPGDERWRALERLLASLPDSVGPLDRLVLTGDLAAHGQAVVYRALRELLAPWIEKLRLVPGNHDESRRLREAFGDRMAPDIAAAAFVEDLPGVRLIGLDSSRTLRVSGKLGRAQRGWLAEKLGAADPVLLFMHHPPLRVGTWWLDKDLLRDRRDLEAMLARARVLGVMCGHVHQPFSGTLGSVPVWTTPSTAYQFLPGSIIPRTARAAPGFRVVEISDGRLETRVVRVS